MGGFIEFLEKLGGKTLEVAERPRRRLPEGKTVQERLRALKELQKELEQEKEQKDERETFIEAVLEQRREEVQQPFAERLASAILKYFRGPVEALTTSLSGLDIDLYRANITMSRELMWHTCLELP